jgi:hypothetical protein
MYICSPIIGEPKFRKQILAELKEEIVHNTIIVAGFNTPHSMINRLSREKSNVEI